MRSRNWSRTLTERSGGNGAVAVFMGMVGAAVLGILLFDEPANASRIISLLMIVAGIIGLKLSTPG